MRARDIRHEGALSSMMAAGAARARRTPRTPRAEAKLNTWIILVTVFIAAGVIIKVATKLL